MLGVVPGEEGPAEGPGVATRPLFVDVETGPGLAHGMTVADWRGTTGRRPNVEVATDGDAAAFLDRLVERVGNLAAGVGALDAEGRVPSTGNRDAPGA
jgi:hypothetical protein